MPSHSIERRLWISSYNLRGRSFSTDNGIRWFRVHIRLRRWREIGGLWWSVPPAERRVRLLVRDPTGVQVPPRHARYR